MDVNSTHDDCNITANKHKLLFWMQMFLLILTQFFEKVAVSKLYHFNSVTDGKVQLFNRWNGWIR